jgi:hypothetical protein
MQRALPSLTSQGNDRGIGMELAHLRLHATAAASSRSRVESGCTGPPRVRRMC